MRIKQPVQIIVSEVANQAGNFQSNVEEVREESLILTYPEENGVKELLVPEKNVVLQIISQEAVFRLYTKISEIWDLPKAVVVEKAGKIEKLQRRKYLRWPAEFSISFIAFDENLEPSTTVAESGRTRDISGGGIQMESRIQLDPEMLVDLNIDFIDGPIQAIGKVRRQQTIDSSETVFLYRLGIEFVDISEEERKRIIAYVIDKQRESREKN